MKKWWPIAAFFAFASLVAAAFVAWCPFGWLSGPLVVFMNTVCLTVGYFIGRDDADAWWWEHNRR